MSMEALITEIQTDLLERGYSLMTNQQLTDNLNTKDRDQNRDSLTGNEMFTSTDATEFAALSDAKKDLWVSWCNADRDPFNSSNIAFVDFIFGGGSATAGTLASIRIDQISRGQEIGFGDVKERDVARARLAIAGG